MGENLKTMGCDENLKFSAGDFGRSDGSNDNI